MTSLFQITVQFKGILKSASFPDSHIYGQFIAIESMSFSERPCYLNMFESKTQ